MGDGWLSAPSRLCVGLILSRIYYVNLRARRGRAGVGRARVGRGARRDQKEFERVDGAGCWKGLCHSRRCSARGLLRCASIDVLVQPHDTTRHASLVFPITRIEPRCMPKCSHLEANDHDIHATNSQDTHSTRGGVHRKLCS